MASFRSYAKLNLHLEVLGRREDGFHELRTLFQTIDLWDELEVDLGGEGISIQVSGAELPTDERNLAVRAAVLFRRHWSGPGIRLALGKRIPLGGGLGGGSSNAAAVLMALCELGGVRPPAAHLEAVARELGADVPFFLHGGTALGTGRGDQIRRLEDPRPDVAIGVALPPVTVATGPVFAAYRPEDRAPRRVPGPAVEAWAPALSELVGWNDLEATCLRLHPSLVAVYNALSVSGARSVRLSGSGAALFALFADDAEVDAAGRRLPAGVRWFPVRALGRSEWLVASGFHDLLGGA